MALLDIGNRASAGFDIREEIAHVTADGRCNVALKVFFGFVLWILFKLVFHILMNGVAVTLRNKIVAVDAGLESAFIAVEGCTPWIFWIGRSAPGAMGPDHFCFTEIEGGGLGVGDVRDALFIDEDSAGGVNFCWPAEVHHPSDHVEHVHAHIAHDTVAIFHKGAPAAWVDNFVVGAHGSGPGPHFVVEVSGRWFGRGITRSTHVVIAIDFDVGDFTELAFLDEAVAGFDEMGCAAALSADLDDAFMFAGGGNHGLPFNDINADRFLDPDIEASLAGFDHGECVPVVGCIDEDEIDVFGF